MEDEVRKRRGKVDVTEYSSPSFDSHSSFFFSFFFSLIHVNVATAILLVSNL